MPLLISSSDQGPRRFRSRAAWATALGALSLAIVLPLTFAGSTLAATPTPVLLGTAGNFAVLAGSGITNTGASTIVGDAGSSPTSTETGFAACPAADCIALTGANHTNPDPNDSVTQSAKAALITAYNGAAGQTPTSVPTELAGQTLPAGVYSSASGTFGMTGTLVLDAANDPNAIFIFQTGSTLITGATGNVSLIRGAQACNVFWQVGSAATLGAGSTFVGTIMAHDDISLGNGVTVQGRLLAAEQGNAGAVTLIHDTISVPQCATAPTPTPAPSASRALYCGPDGKSYNLAEGQDKQAPYASLGLVPAHVDAVTGAKSCDFIIQEAQAVAAANVAAAAAAKAEAAAAALKIAEAKAAAAKAVAAARTARIAATKARTARATAAAKLAAAKAAAARAAVKAAAARAAATLAKPAVAHVGFTG